MPGQRRIGADHDFYDWSPLTQRLALRWPDGARVALCILVTLDDRLIDPPPGDPLLARLMERPADAPYPDLGGYTAAQYSLRNGLFRVMKVLDRYQIAVAVAMDAQVAMAYPFIVEECQRRGWEFVAHGLVGNAPLTNRLAPEIEREYIQRSVHAIARATGSAPAGWFGTDYQGSSRSLAVLAEAGIQYVLDWPNDEQPYLMRATGRGLVSLPALLELDDQYALIHRRVTAWRWEQMVRDAFDTLYVEGAESGRLLILSIHPAVIGRAFRIRSLDTVLAYLSGRHGVWSAPPRQIADRFVDQSASAIRASGG